MRKSIIFLSLILILGAVLLFWEGLLDFYSKMILRFPQLEREVPALVQEVSERIATPPPLIVEERLAESFLTQVGIVQWTNIQREKYGLPPLKESSQLNTSALLKAEDMLAKQYFGHISPSGKGVADLAETASYQFIAIGENLALGDFENDEKLIQGWLASPGHRANILNPRYQEIGVAVLQGEFEGRTTWLAVQHFGLPSKACPEVPEEISAEILANQKRIDELNNILLELQQEIKTMRPKRGLVFNQKVEEYNNLVSQYNVLLAETKKIIEQYNNQVILFNECVARTGF